MSKMANEVTVSVNLRVKVTNPEGLRAEYGDAWNLTDNELRKWVREYLLVTAQGVAAGDFWEVELR